MSSKLFKRTVGGVGTEFLECWSTLGALRDPRFLVFFPGNPGAIEFYRFFLGRLAEKSGVRVVGVGLAGHTRSELNGGRFFTLQDQVEHKVAAVKSLLEDKEASLAAAAAPAAGAQRRALQAPRVLLCGHSIGAWIGLRALDVLMREREAAGAGGGGGGGDSPFCGFLGLTPTVELLGNQAKPGVPWLVAWPLRPLLALLLGAFGAVASQPWREWLMRAGGGATDETAAVAADAGRYAFYQNYLGLAQDEFRTLLRFTEAVPGAPCTAWEGTPASAPQLQLGGFLRALAAMPTATTASGGGGGALRMIFVHQDEWVPLDYVARLQLWLDHRPDGAGAGARCCRVMEDKRVPHGFVGERGDAEAMAREAAADMVALGFADADAE